MSNYDRNAYPPQWGTGAARVDAAAYDQGLRGYMLGIYNHMTVGLAVSALVALLAYKFSFVTGPTGRLVPTGLGQALFFSPLRWVVLLAPLGFVMVLSFGVARMSYTALLGTFYAFAGVMGLGLTPVLMLYTGASVFQTFFVTAAAFAGLSAVGYTTKRDLSAMGKFLIMGLIGLVIAGLVNLFVQSSAFQFALNALGVLVFAGLTAYDTQRLRQDYDLVAGDGELTAKSSLMGALTLYLNFVNMFQMLLSLFGTRNSD